MRVLPKRFRALVLSFGVFALLGWIAADGQSAAPPVTAPKATDSSSTGPVPAASSATAPIQATSSAIAPNSEVDVLNHVNRVLEWFHQWGSANAYAVVPGDELFVENGQDIARKVTNLEFQSALAQAAMLADSSNRSLPPQGNAPGSFGAHNLLKAQQNVDQKLKALEAQLDTVNKQIPTARAKQRPALQSQRDALQGQIALAQALQSNLQQLTSFANATDAANGVATELTTKLRGLQRTIPAAAIPAGSTTQKSTAKNSATPSQVQFPSFAGARSEGLIGQMGQIIHLVSSLRSLDQLKDETTRLQADHRAFARTTAGSVAIHLAAGSIRTRKQCSVRDEFCADRWRRSKRKSRCESYGVRFGGFKESASSGRQRNCATGDCRTAPARDDPAGAAF